MDKKQVDPMTLDLWTIKQAAEYLQVCQETVRRLLYGGKNKKGDDIAPVLTPLKTPGIDSVRIKREQVMGVFNDKKESKA